MCFTGSPGTGKTTVAIDTILIEPEEYRLVLVWRLVISDGDIKPTRAAEFRMRTFLDRDTARTGPECQHAAQERAAEHQAQATQP